MFPHSGNYYAVLGATNITYLSQTLATTVGEPYLLSLWLYSPDGLTPNAFQVSWNGTAIFNQTNLPASFGWTNLQIQGVGDGHEHALGVRIPGHPKYSWIGRDQCHR